MSTSNQKRRTGTPTASVLLLIGLALTFTGCKKSQPPIPTWRSGTTTIPGTFGWDAETNTIVAPDNADLWWEMVSETQRCLVPCQGARAAVVKHKSYEEVTGRYLERWHMPEEKIAGSGDSGVLSPGTVIAFRTAEGNFGKLQVVGFKPLHDLSFPEASVYSEQWKTEAAARPNHERYHIEIKWTFCQLTPDM
jgi:hypothetical protein